MCKEWNGRCVNWAQAILTRVNTAGRVNTDFDTGKNGGIALFRFFVIYLTGHAATTERTHEHGRIHTHARSHTKQTRPSSHAHNHDAQSTTLPPPGLDLSRVSLCFPRTSEGFFVSSPGLARGCGLGSWRGSRRRPAT